MVDGDRRSWTKEIPPALREAVNQASILKRAKIENRRTCFYFVRRLTSELADRGEQMKIFWLTRSFTISGKLTETPNITRPVLR